MRLLLPLCFALAGCAPVFQTHAPDAESALIVAGVRPSIGAEGDVLLIEGAGFTRPDDTRVSFGGAPAAEIRIVDGAHMEVVVPPGVGLVDVCIANSRGAWVALAGFSYEGSSDGTVKFCWEVASR